MNIRSLFYLPLLALFTAMAPPTAGPRRDFRPLASGSLMEDKNFYLLTALTHLPAARAAMLQDPILAREAARERAAVVAALGRAGALHPLCAEQLRPSGRFQLYAALDDAALLRVAWRDAAAGINHIVRVWGMGEKPLYPLIDSRSYTEGDKL